MTRITTLASLTIGVLLLAACGGGGGDSAPPAAPAPPGGSSGLTTVTEYYPNGDKKAEGTVQADDAGNPITDSNGDQIKEGDWTMWFPGGQVQWQGSYDDGAVDEDQAWREYNIDGSIRDDWQDG